VIEDFHLDFEAKRDRWNGYDTSLHMREMEKHNVYEEERKRIRQEEMAAKAKRKEERKMVAAEAEAEASEKASLGQGNGNAPDERNKKPLVADDSSEDEDNDADGDEDEEGVMQKVGEDAQLNLKMETATCLVRTSHRNLRIREDTAKYLLNLDVNSAYYDPKTRAMRADPLAGTDKDTADSDRLYRGENYERNTGKTKEFNNLQCFAWDSQEKGSMVHAQAMPSQAEIMKREYEAKKNNLKQQTKSDIIAKYGGERHMDSLPKPLLWGQSEHYVEYSTSGKVIKGQEKAMAKSKYDENVLVQNHTAVWGSFWENGQWGYACCKQTHRNAYCVADTLRKEATERTGEGSHKEQLMEGIGFEESPNAFSNTDAPKAKNGTPKSKGGTIARHGDDVEKLDLDAAALKSALKRQHLLNEERGIDSRKRKYNSMGDSTVTQEELEAYRLTRTRSDDPMANFT